MHVAGREKIKSGFTEAENRMVHHGGSFEYVPARAWAQLGDRYFAIEQITDLSPPQMIAKCEAMLRNGAGWTIPEAL